MPENYPISISFHTWFDGDSHKNPDDVRRKILQRIFNNAVNRKRPISLNSRTGELSIKLESSEIELASRAEKIIKGLTKQREIIDRLNGDCVALSTALLTSEKKAKPTEEQVQ